LIAVRSGDGSSARLFCCDHVNRRRSNEPPYRSATSILKLPTFAAWSLMAACVATQPMPSSAAALEPWTTGPRPAFALERLQGGRTDLAAFRGRVVLVHFFATWCEPCRAEMASLQRLAARYANRPLAILAVNVAEVAPRVIRFFESQPVSFAVVLDSDRAVTKAWRIEALPTTVVLDPTLTPVRVAGGDLDWDRADVDAIINALLPDAASEPDKKRP
jgi:thiol-disulfide isomerase/thioredoxin